MNWSPLPRIAAVATLAAVAAAVPITPAQPPASAAPAALIALAAPELALVHPDALAFAHVRLADVWADPTMKEFRGVFEKAGPKPFATLDEQFVPKPSTIDRVTLVVLPLGATPEPRGVGIFRFKSAFDRAAVLKAHLPGGVAAKAGDKEIVADERGRMAVYTPDARTIVFSDPETLKEYLTWAPKADGGLAPALRTSPEKAVTAAINVARLPLPPDALDTIPEEFRPLGKAQLVTLTMGLGKGVALDLRATFPNGTDAVQGEKALRKALDLARAALARPRQEALVALEGKGEKGTRKLDQLPEAVAALAALGGLATLDEILADPPVTRDGSALAASVTLPPWVGQYLGSAAVSAGLMLPAVQKVRGAAARSQAMNNLKQIGLAMHNYHDTYNGFPPAAITDKKGKALLSWRVAILPFIEQQALYQQFKLDEPWDSEHNKKLAMVVPKVYIDPRLPNTVPAEGKTIYKVFVGGGAAFDPVKPRGINTITDGTSNTFLVAAGGDPVLWTKPDDIPFDPEKPVPDLSKPFPLPDLLIAFGDGSVRAFRADRFKTDEKTLKAYITAGGGEVVTDND